MLVKPITYTDLNGEKRTEEFCFHLSRAEIVELNSKYPGGIQKRLKRIVAEKDNEKIFAEFKAIIMMAYGEVSEDGRYFRKSPEMALAFTQSCAYDELIVELFTKDGYAAEFVSKIIPQQAEQAQ